VLQCVAASCSVLQCVLCYSVLQCVAVFYSDVKRTTIEVIASVLHCVAVCRSVLHCAACVLQCVAVCCRVL